VDWIGLVQDRCAPVESSAEYGNEPSGQDPGSVGL
jgi:hypothetical protein